MGWLLILMVVVAFSACALVFFYVDDEDLPSW